MDKIVIFGKTQGFESYEIDLLERSEGVKNIYTHPKVLPLENGQFMLHYSFSRETACLSLYTRVINLGSERDGLIFGVAYKTDKNFDLLTVLNNILYPLYRGASTLLLNEDKDKIIHESIVEVLEREIYSQISNWGIKPCVSTSMAESPDSGKIRMLLVSSDKNFQDISNIQSTIKDYSDVYICKYPEVFKSDINSVALRSCKGKIAYIPSSTLIVPGTSDKKDKEEEKDKQKEKGVSTNPPPKPPIEEYDIVFKTLISPVESDFDFIVKNTYPQTALNALRFELIGGKNIAKINGSRLTINPNRKNREVENVYIQVSYNGKILKGVSYDIAPQRRRPLHIVLISSVIAVIAISIATLFIIEKHKKPDPPLVVIQDTVKVEDPGEKTLSPPIEPKNFCFKSNGNNAIKNNMPLVNYEKTSYERGEYTLKLLGDGSKYARITLEEMLCVNEDRPDHKSPKMVTVVAYDNNRKEIASQKYWIAAKNKLNGEQTFNTQSQKPSSNKGKEGSPQSIEKQIMDNYVLILYNEGRLNNKVDNAKEFYPYVGNFFVLKLEKKPNAKDLNIDSSNIVWEYKNEIFQDTTINDKFAIKLIVKDAPKDATDATEDLTIRCCYGNTQVKATIIGGIIIPEN